MNIANGRMVRRATSILDVSSDRRSIIEKVTEKKCLDINDLNFK